MRVEPVREQPTVDSSPPYDQGVAFQIPPPLSQAHPGVSVEYPRWGKAAAAAAVRALAAFVAFGACALLVGVAFVVWEYGERNLTNPNALMAISRKAAAMARKPLLLRRERRPPGRAAGRGARGRGG